MARTRRSHPSGSNSPAGGGACAKGRREASWVMYSCGRGARWEVQSLARGGERGMPGSVVRRKRKHGAGGSGVTSVCGGPLSSRQEAWRAGGGASTWLHRFSFHQRGWAGGQSLPACQLHVCMRRQDSPYSPVVLSGSLKAPHSFTSLAGPSALEALPLLHRKGARSQRGAEAGVERRGRLPLRALLLAEPRCPSPSPGQRGPPPSSRSAAWAGPDRERSGPGAAAAGPWKARGLAGLPPRAGRAPARAPAPSRPSSPRACTESTASAAACTPSSPTRCRSPPSSSTGEAAWGWRSGGARRVVWGWEIFVCSSEVLRGTRGALRGACGAFRGSGGLAWG